MLVVADSSPLIALVNIDSVAVLPRLFQQIVIPPKIAAELALPARPESVQSFIQNPPPWLVIRKPLNVEMIPDIHDGEREAISLAQELRAQLLLIDDKDGKRAARERDVPVTGTLGVIERAAQQGFLDLSDAFERLKRTDFWISDALLDERLKIYQESKPK